MLLDFECALTEAGFGVVAVTSGSKAIEHLTAADSSIQGIVTDIRFGESPDGWEVARVAREIDPGMPVVYVSGHGAVDFPSRGVPKSVMLEKPFDMAQLVTAISQLLDERSSETLPPPPASDPKGLRGLPCAYPGAPRLAPVRARS
nr:response regulator [Sinorhizobium mexicanum]